MPGCWGGIECLRLQRWWHERSLYILDSTLSAKLKPFMPEPRTAARPQDQLLKPEEQGYSMRALGSLVFLRSQG